MHKVEAIAPNQAERPTMPVSYELSIIPKMRSELSVQALRATAAELTSSETAARLGLAPEDLVRDVLLNCPHAFADEIGTLYWQQYVHGRFRELVRERLDVPVELRRIQEGAKLGDFSVRPIAEITALEMHAKLHYLKSPRSNSINLGLFGKERSNSRAMLAGVATISGFDLHHLSGSLPPQFDSKRSAILSRLYLVRGCPRNTGSRFLGRVFDWMRANVPEIRTLISYCNPNLGFYGSVYRASNWTLLGLEPKLHDVLVDGKYVTLRELKSRYGSWEPATLKRHLGARLHVQPAAALPLQVYGYELRREGRPQVAKLCDGAADA
jgi:hypothetical protein